MTASTTNRNKTRRLSSARRRIIARCFPVVCDDDDFFAVAKAPMLELESVIHKRGPASVDVLNDCVSDRPSALLEPMVLPEYRASGVAVFARNDDAARRFAQQAAAGRLRYTHVVLATGKPPRQRIAISPGSKGKAAPDKQKPDKPAGPRGKIDIIKSAGDRHLVRCVSADGGMVDLRRLLRQARLSIVGDIDPRTQADKPLGRRRLWVHLERVELVAARSSPGLVLQCELPADIEAALAGRTAVAELLQVALARRLACLIDGDTNCMRLFGAREGIGGFSAELYDRVVLMDTLEGMFNADEQTLRQAGNWYASMLGADSIYHRHVPRPQTRSRRAKHNTEPELLKGKPVNEITVTENGLRFIVRLEDVGPVGLFCDQRDNRRRIRRLAADRDVLNLFAYTCSFSVAAAAGGASSTTSVDQAISHLEWGKRNFVANDMSLDDHVFIRQEAFDFFNRARRQNRQFDLMIIDPPSFSRSKRPKRVFQVRDDMVALIKDALTVLRPEGIMLLSTNNRQLSLRWLAEQVELAARKRSYRVLARPSLPPDYAPDRDYQKTILLQFS